MTLSTGEIGIDDIYYEWNKETVTASDTVDISTYHNNFELSGITDMGMNDFHGQSCVKFECDSWVDPAGASHTTSADFFLENNSRTYAEWTFNPKFTGLSSTTTTNLSWDIPAYSVQWNRGTNTTIIVDMAFEYKKGGDALWTPLGSTTMSTSGYYGWSAADFSGNYTKVQLDTWQFRFSYQVTTGGWNLTEEIYGYDQRFGVETITKPAYVGNFDRNVFQLRGPYYDSAVSEISCYVYFINP